MTDQSKILLVFFLCVFIVAVVLFVVLRKKKVVKPKVKKNYDDEFDWLLELDEHEKQIST